MARYLITGGAGFIGRWLVKERIEAGHEVCVVDDLSNGSLDNLHELAESPNLLQVFVTDLEAFLDDPVREDFDGVFHIAAQINVQNSIDDPDDTFRRDGVLLHKLLEWVRKRRIPMIFASTCMVYQAAAENERLSESSKISALSPYSAWKIAGEYLCQAYANCYDLDIHVARPFNTYGPFQRSDGEGGVIAKYARLKNADQKLPVFGSGTQTRDFVYATDCAAFLGRFMDRAKDIGSFKILQYGSGEDISILDLVKEFGGDLEFKEHPHPEAEIQRMPGGHELASELLEISPAVSLSEGISHTLEFFRDLED